MEVGQRSAVPHRMSAFPVQHARERAGQVDTGSPHASALLRVSSPISERPCRCADAVDARGEPGGLDVHFVNANVRFSRRLPMKSSMVIVTLLSACLSS